MTTVGTTTGKRQLDLIDQQQQQQQQFETQNANNTRPKDSTENATTNPMKKQDLDNKTNTEQSNGNSKKKQLLDPEARNKRTAQNRAAQRAFRERKERKMKELEEKVANLTKIQKQNEIESEFLRSQLITLVNELKKYKPNNENASKVLNYISNSNSNSNPDLNLNSKFSPMESDASAMKRSTGSVSSGDSNSRTMTSMDAPSMSTTTSVQSNPLNLKPHNNMTLNDILPPATTVASTSTLDANPSSTLFDSLLANDDLFTQQLMSFANNANNNNNNNDSVTTLDNSNTQQQNLQQPQITPPIEDSNLISNSFDFNDKFDEQVSDFCGKMSMACGTRSNPIPKSKSNVSTPQSIMNSNNKSPISPLNDSTLAKSNVITTSNIFDHQSNTPQAINSNLTNTWGIPSASPNSNDSSPNNIVPTQDNSNVNMNFGQLGFMMDSPQFQNIDLSLPIENDKFSASNFKKPSLPFINPTLAFPNDDLFNKNNSNNDNNNNTTTTHDESDLLSQFLANDYSNTISTNNLMNSDDDEDEDDDDYEKKLVANNLINEEPSSTNKNNNLTSTSKEQENNDFDDFIVPSRDGGLLRCSEIWDRITAHPKYSELDIDGLCSELMTKAKCSERGVVVNAEDVQMALTKHMS
ncbi:DNA-binding transcription factor YAP1 NDAI_0C01060 [Naumovozyma dairenensis CBS 421]|uniref:BZIP domain-containing protein n=1 Tax=Naumovozyma dairenensis (strain ATCC 10597 / BCRC 20456 / CBS 421 / NBRC 0211 / NRRL Y-12639) TaxID=1071378 RepID=G0W7K6_NAUDC|nr:hypothetical protein NDAI_0C01060 [Naumovozyma dairenensis CBS 421]CCD23767.1 hypothetical protein NDAI_0C01060 [Naumovozyma dairenensis CBS 421]